MVMSYNPVKISAKRQDRKRRVIDKYGGKCACCGELQLAFLCIDHVHGGGNKHRKIIRAANIYWFLDDLAPARLDRFRVLCHNCNFAIGAYGFCPHGPRGVGHE